MCILFLLATLSTIMPSSSDIVLINNDYVFLIMVCAWQLNVPCGLGSKGSNDS